MPIFEYACGQCQHEFEALVRGDTALHCPSCGSTALTKQLSVFATAATHTAAESPALAGPCGTCGHPDGPGSCAVH